MADLMLGQNDDDPDGPKIRQKFIKKMAIKLLPFLDIGEYDDLLEQSKLEVVKDKNLDKSSGGSDNPLGGESSDDEFL
jgi:hypothetical protein